MPENEEPEDREPETTEPPERVPFGFNPRTTTEKPEEFKGGYAPSQDRSAKTSGRRWYGDTRPIEAH